MTKMDKTHSIPAESINAIRRNFPFEKLDDDTISRFLIARNNDITKTTDMIQNYFLYKQTYHVDAIKPPNGKDIPYTLTVRKLRNDVNYDVNAVGVPEEFKKFYPATGGMAVHGMDMQGHPVLIELLGKYNVKKMAELCEPEALKKLCILNNEFLFGQILDECSQIHGSRVQRMVGIFDCSGMGLHQFHVPGIMLLKVVASLNQDYYPERLHKLFIVNAPVFFSAAWAIIKVGLDKRVLDKVFVLGSDYKNTLLKHINHDQLPHFLGGSCTCSHMNGGCVPSPGENIPADKNAYRFKNILKKSKVSHEHIIKIQESAPVKFKYESQALTNFEIINGTKVIFSSEASKLTDQSLHLVAGTYVFRWIGRNLGFRASSLEYSISFKLSHSDSGIILGDEYVDAQEITNYDIFDDCVCTYITPLVTVTHSVTVSESKYDGIVVTSKRSLEALKDQLSLRQKTLFVVGPATEAKALEMGFLNVLGAESGSAVGLVDHIVRKKHDRLLLLTGDKNRDDLPQALDKVGLQFDQLQVYTTSPNPNLQRDLCQLNTQEWMVFFSPSGFDAVNVYLKDFPKIACIGKTTAAHILSLGYTVTAVAQKPDPASLYHAMFKI